MGILPMFFLVFFFSDRNGNSNGNSKDMGRMPMLHTGGTPVRLMSKMPMLRFVVRSHSRSCI